MGGFDPRARRSARRELYALLNRLTTSVRVATRFEVNAREMADSPETAKRHTEAAERNRRNADEAEQAIKDFFATLGGQQ